MEKLVEEARKGDMQSYTELMKKLEKDLYRIAHTRLSNDDDIFDAIQNTMINVYQHIKKLKNYDYFKTWVIRILLNECNKIYKQNIRNKRILEKTTIKIDVNNEIIKSKEYEEFRQFDKMIASLNSEEQLIFTLFYKDGYSCKEISKITRIKENTIKSKLDRGREKLKKFLGEERKEYERK